MICQRCKKETLIHTMSMFNTQEICLECEEREKDSPRYQEAREAELKAVQSGNYNFKGIGL